MKAKITITTDNAAFADNTGAELARILRRLADNLDGRTVHPGELITLRDLNGNRVGDFDTTR